MTVLLAATADGCTVRDWDAVALFLRKHLQQL